MSNLNLWNCFANYEKRKSQFSDWNLLFKHHIRSHFLCNFFKVSNIIFTSLVRNIRLRKNLILHSVKSASKGDVAENRITRFFNVSVLYFYVANELTFLRVSALSQCSHSSRRLVRNRKCRFNVVVYKEKRVMWLCRKFTTTSILMRRSLKMNKILSEFMLFDVSRRNS
jgi:hypothetical protein